MFPNRVPYLVSRQHAQGRNRCQPTRDGIPQAGGTPVEQRTFDYEAVLDRCFVRFGGDLFVPQLGRGFIGLQETAPFTVNNPQQGDIILGPGVQPACAVPTTVLNRRG